MSDSSDIMGKEDPELTVPALPETIHSCGFCYVQEIDPGLNNRDGQWSSTALKYRGSRVLDGASNGCVLFQDILRSLETILGAYGYEQGSSSVNFLPENWVYQLSFSRTYGRLEMGGRNLDLCQG